MATIAAILDAVADQIRDQFTAVTDIDISVEGRAFKAATLPAVDMYLTGINGLDDGLASFYDTVGGFPVSIRVRVQPADLYAGEDLLLAFMDDEDPLSIIAALNTDRTIGGLVETLKWGEWTGYTDFPTRDSDGGEGSYLGSLLPIILVKAHS
jgi:hypothetical protein